jgi:hypothetical protein
MSVSSLDWREVALICSLSGSGLTHRRYPREMYGCQLNEAHLVRWANEWCSYLKWKENGKWLMNQWGHGPLQWKFIIFYFNCSISKIPNSICCSRVNTRPWSIDPSLLLTIPSHCLRGFDCGNLKILCDLCPGKSKDFLRIWLVEVLA